MTLKREMGLFTKPSKLIAKKDSKGNRKTGTEKNQSGIVCADLKPLMTLDGPKKKPP